MTKAARGSAHGRARRDENPPASRGIRAPWRQFTPRLPRGHFAPRASTMAKGQKKSNKEARKPKADKGPKQNASQPSLKPGGIKGLENMKNK
jgi:hypothetical protein